MVFRDKAGTILYFSFCQQIPSLQYVALSPNPNGFKLKPFVENKKNIDKHQP